MRRNADEQRLAAPLLGDQLVLRELPANAIEIAAGLVDLVDRDDDRHLRRFRVLNGFDRLRHDAVVGRHDEHDDVRDLGAARAHGREGRVARRVEERDAALRRLDVVGADVLRDAAGFARGDLRTADVVEQRRLAVIDVAHDRDDGRARHSLGRARGLFDGLDELVLDRRFLERLRGMAHLLDDERRRVLIEDLVDRDHHAHLHEGLDDLVGLHGHAAARGR